MENKKEKPKRVLVAGASGRRGRKVKDFLSSRGALVYGADRFVRKDDIKGSTRFFRLNLGHRDSVGLMFRIVRADALAYCAVTRQNRDNFSTYLNTLLLALKHGVRQVFLVLNGDVKEKPKDIYEVTELAMALVTKVYSKNSNFSYKIIGPGDNLLKEVKKFLKSG